MDQHFQPFPRFFKPDKVSDTNAASIRIEIPSRSSIVSENGYY